MTATPIGIDIGAQTIHICIATPADPRTWPVHPLQLTSTTWHHELIALVPPEAIIALEPTGWYYSRPIVTALSAIPGTTVLYVTHETTGAARQDRISRQKTDATDARALALKARDYTETGHSNGTHPADLTLDDLNIALRLHIHARRRAIQERTANLNHLTQLAHGIWPALAQHKTAYLLAIPLGAITPRDLHALAQQIALGNVPPTFKHPARRRVLASLVQNLPIDLPVPAPLIEAILSTHAAYLAADATATRHTETIGDLIQDPAIAEITRCWRTIPGASDTTIAAIHSATRCRAHHLTPDQFRAAVGCHPSRDESGRTTETSETKRGFRPAKAGLHLWTLYLLNPSCCPSNPVRDYFQRLKAAHNPSAVHAARGKLARVLSGIARNLTPYTYQAKQQADGTEELEQTF